MFESCNYCRDQETRIENENLSFLLPLRLSWNFLHQKDYRNFLFLRVFWDENLRILRGRNQKSEVVRDLHIDWRFCCFDVVLAVKILEIFVFGCYRIKYSCFF